MSIILYDYSLSSSCYKVRLLLNFLELDYEARPVDYYPGFEHRSLGFRKINPLNQLPAADIDGVRLRDAQAILCHIANKYDHSGRWLPKETEIFGQVMMWVMFASSELMAASAARLHDLFGFDLDIEGARKKAYEAFRVLDDHLTHREIEGAQWLVGRYPTIADVACFPYPALSSDGGLALEDFPAIRNWLLRIRRLPNFTIMSGIPETI